MFKPIRRIERFETSTVLPSEMEVQESSHARVLLCEAVGDASELCVKLRHVGRDWPLTRDFPRVHNVILDSLGMEGQFSPS